MHNFVERPAVWPDERLQRPAGRITKAATVEDKTALAAVVAAFTGVTKP